VCLIALLGLPAAAQVSPGPLARAHLTLEGNTHCLDCHATQSDGMDQRCLDCHREIAALRSAGRGLHARTGDERCAKCHPDHAGVEFELIEWPGGRPEAFDHAKAGWPLAGKHAALRCAECHQKKFRKGPATEASNWVGLEPACGSCHTDPHRGALGADCARCHSASDWKKTPGFDHGTTDFPLAGKHTGLACAKCHTIEGQASPLYKPLPHAECSSCHKDAHAGRLGAKCASCHVAASWREVAPSSFDHARTRYPLRGAHAQVACAKCHDRTTAFGPKPAFAACADCHRDPHAGRATLAGAKVDCGACHDVERFRPGVLAPARHAPDRFPLEGKHGTVRCADCHRTDRTPSGVARLGQAAVDLHPPHERCSTCHTDAHGGQLASRPDGGECAACHGVQGWKPSRFTVAQHAELALPLEGAHATAACAACHGPERPGLAPLPATLATGKARVALRGIERDCAGCHRDPHRFPSPKPCVDCHDARSFVPAAYGPREHARAAFPLEGAHRATPCALCHADLRTPATKGSLRQLPLRDARRACAECHADPHEGQLRAADGPACERCHVVEAFQPATRFDHDRDSSFRLGAAHARVKCAACHPTRPGATARPVVVYRGVPARCTDCHGPRSTRKEGEAS